MFHCLSIQVPHLTNLESRPIHLSSAVDQSVPFPCDIIISRSVASRLQSICQPSNSTASERLAEIADFTEYNIVDLKYILINCLV